MQYPMSYISGHDCQLGREFQGLSCFTQNGNSSVGWKVKKGEIESLSWKKIPHCQPKSQRWCASTLTFKFCPLCTLTVYPFTASFKYLWHGVRRADQFEHCSSGWCSTLYIHSRHVQSQRVCSCATRDGQSPSEMAVGSVEKDVGSQRHHASMVYHARVWIGTLTIQLVSRGRQCGCTIFWLNPTASQ